MSSSVRAAHRGTMATGRGFNRGRGGGRKRWSSGSRRSSRVQPRGTVIESACRRHSTPHPARGTSAMTSIEQKTRVVGSHPVRERCRLGCMPAPSPSLFIDLRAKFADIDPNAKAICRIVIPLSVAPLPRCTHDIVSLGGVRAGRSAADRSGTRCGSIATAADTDPGRPEGDRRDPDRRVRRRLIRIRKPVTPVILGRPERLDVAMGA